MGHAFCQAQDPDLLQEPGDGRLREVMVVVVVVVMVVMMMMVVVLVVMVVRAVAV